MKSLRVLLFVLLVPPSVQAQVGSSAPVPNDSSWAISFSVDGLYVRPFDAAGIAVKKHVSPSAAFRLGVTVSGNGGSAEIKREEFVGDSLILRATDSNASTATFNFLTTVHGLLYFETPTDALVFVGGGPEVGYSSQDAEDENFNNSWRVGVEGLLGAEWFATTSISIHAEYRLSLNYRFSNRVTTSTSTDSVNIIERRTEIETRGWNVSSGTVVFGVSAYF